MIGVYSLAFRPSEASAVGYYLLTGTPLFVATDVREYIRLHQAKQPEPLRSRKSDIPDDLERAILKGLSKDPGMRAKNAVTMRAQLLDCDAAGSWLATEADEWWASFEKPSPLEHSTSSSGSESILATALIGEATALLIDSAHFEAVDDEDAETGG